ncbi:hypothetical protein AC23_4913 [Escherichia coli 7-233-03_S3_C2]|nr:hypothetical protein AC86_5098 [Escherichia coli 3-073-06_S4_C1]KDZ79838.1 hypothetical protein AD42_4029 [Escherichia coli 3-073-06_S4_C3]KEN18092.1 hypothetical protein AC23_4913 [Escherichia coli 7-233-03_S3_C2]
MGFIGELPAKIDSKSVSDFSCTRRGVRNQESRYLIVKCKKCD